MKQFSRVAQQVEGKGDTKKKIQIQSPIVPSEVTSHANSYSKPLFEIQFSNMICFFTVRVLESVSLNRKNWI